MSDEEEYLKEEENYRRRLAQRRLPFAQLRNCRLCAHSVTGAGAAAERARTLFYQRLGHSVRSGQLELFLRQPSFTRCQG